MPRRTGRSTLAELAGLYGVQTWHLDGFKRRHRPGEETVLAVLNALGAGVERVDQAGDAVRRRKSGIAARTVEPVQVSWSDGPVVFRLRLDAGNTASLRLTLTGENGVQHIFTASAKDLVETGSDETDGRDARELAWTLSSDLPGDIYQCTLELGGEAHFSTLLRAPVRAAGLPPVAQQRRLGLFLPTYAIRSHDSWGMGDFTGLSRLMGLADQTGAGVVATLPLLPVFEEDPSPYSPVSKLAWNELYVDPREAAEFASCDAARQLVESKNFLAQVESLERADLVDYAAQFALRKPVLEALAQQAAATPQVKRELERFAAQYPHVDSYAKFRAAREKLGPRWQDWKLRAGSDLREGEHYDSAAYTYHLNSQRLASQQVEKLVRPDDPDSPVLYLDMPLGVRGDGFDTWLKPKLFANGITAGSPPDGFFTGGQNWGFPPMKPDALRQDGYRYVRDTLRHIISRAGIMRIDHVMGMHRLYWVPEGITASHGAYVHYPAEEMYALVTLESQRAGAAVVGEDLGTVPRYVGPAMKRHNLYRMYVDYFNVQPGKQPSLRSPDADMFAYVNTHDLATFAGYLAGDDIEDRHRLGLLTEEQMQEEKRGRVVTADAIRNQVQTDGFLDPADTAPEDFLRAVLRWLRATNAAVTIVNLEDLWLETRPQNTPGTSTERPNWKVRAQLGLRQVRELIQAAGL